MLTLTAKTRQIIGRQVKQLREQGILPAVLYGQGKKNLSLAVDAKEFKRIYDEAGESSMVSLEVEGDKGKHLVLIQEVQKDPVSDQFIHADLHEVSMDQEIEANIPLVFEGEAPAVKELGGTLIKHIQEIEVKALPQNLPPVIKVNVENLKSFEDDILVKDLAVDSKVEILKEANEIVALVAPPEKVEEELEKPIEEGVAEPEVEGEKEEGAEEEAEQEPKEASEEK